MRNDPFRFPIVMAESPSKQSNLVAKW